MNFVFRRHRKLSLNLDNISLMSHSTLAMFGSSIFKSYHVGTAPFNFEDYHYRLSEDPSLCTPPHTLVKQFMGSLEVYPAFFGHTNPLVVNNNFQVPLTSHSSTVIPFIPTPCSSHRCPHSAQPQLTQFPTDAASLELPTDYALASVVEGLKKYLDVSSRSTPIETCPSCHQKNCHRCPKHYPFHTCLPKNHSNPYIYNNLIYNATLPPDALPPCKPSVPDIRSFQLSSFEDSHISPRCRNLDCCHPVAVREVMLNNSAACSSLSGIVGVAVSKPPVTINCCPYHDVPPALFPSHYPSAPVAPNTITHSTSIVKSTWLPHYRHGCVRALSSHGVTTTSSGVWNGKQLVFTTNGNPTAWWPSLCSPIWSNIERWDFDIFELDQVTLHRPLSALVHYIAYRHGWFNHFSLSPFTLGCFLTALEDGYVDNPYHNRIHAADVVHSVYVLYLLGLKAVNHEKNKTLGLTHESVISTELTVTMDKRISPKSPIIEPPRNEIHITPNNFSSLPYGPQQLWQKYEDTNWYRQLPETMKQRINVSFKLHKTSNAPFKETATINGTSGDSGSGSRKMELLNTDSQVMEAVDLICHSSHRPNRFEDHPDKIYKNDYRAMLYDTISKTSSRSYFATPLARHLDMTDMFSLIIAAAIHDYKHPGVTNMSLLAMKNDISYKFNNIATLEQFHCVEALALLNRPQFDILSGLNATDRRRVRDDIVSCVMATDMRQHATSLEELESLICEKKCLTSSRNNNTGNSIVSHYPNVNANDKRILMQAVIHAADIANPTKPLPLCVQWAERINDEWHVQRQLEDKLNIPTLPMMVREISTLPNSQIGFLGFIALPYFEALANVVAGAADCVVFAHANLGYWRDASYRLEVQQTEEEKLAVNTLKKKIEEEYNQKTKKLNDDISEEIKIRYRNLSKKITKEI